MNERTQAQSDSELKYLRLLAARFKNIGETTTEIINLQAILNLPKGTEHFLTDIHGEFEAFDHVIRNGSGAVKEKIKDIFGDTIGDFEKTELATVIYYPREKIDLLSQGGRNIDMWYKSVMHRLIEVCSVVSSKYTSSKVKKAMPPDFQYILQELIYERKDLVNRREYVESIIDTIISIGRARSFVVAISRLIQHLIIDKLHIVGDIYDRGPLPHLIMDLLERYHDADIQWGNHDMLWMGAAIGNRACIANVVRICARYSNNDILDEAYGINLLPLATFAMDTYGNDPCVRFMPKEGEKSKFMARIHKAISVIQFKLEGQLIGQYPEWQMDDRDCLSRLNYKDWTLNVDGVDYPLNDKNFPTVDPEDPLRLTEREEEIMTKLQKFFLRSEKLQRHVEFLITKGSMYLCYNNNLLYHGCIPLREYGTFQDVDVFGKKIKGKKYLDELDKIVRTAYLSRENPARNQKYIDFIWYLWCGPYSPLFGKHAMKTFERYFIDDKATHTEMKNPYYSLYDKEDICDMILEEFGLNPTISHIINGHVPVKVKKGEVPIKAGGKLFIIDGGFSKAYQKETGIAGYTLISNSWGLKLVSHEPFESREKAIVEGKDILSSSRIVEDVKNRTRVRDTDIGRELQRQVNDLKKLLNAYKKGIIKERYKKTY
ncbi:MAG: fructose-1,6-bisphosphatase [Fusobacteriaceae bacterium]|jgi:fructose-1,6-bisphosphatase-3|nr:fructose-1,6-bisphosphatase [Fusobacteriaceae bacterium]